MKTMITIMIRLMNRLTHFVGALSLHLSLALLALLVQHCALDLQVVDHPLPGHLPPPHSRELDGHVDALGVVKPDHPLAGLRVSGAETDHHIIIVLLHRVARRSSRHRTTCRPSSCPA